MNSTSPDSTPTLGLGNAPVAWPEHEAVVAEVLTELRAEFGVALTSVVLCGSLAHGNARRDSDVDLVVLTSEKWSEVRRLRRGGVDIDLFVHWSEHVRARALLGGLYPVLHMLARGVVLIDTDGVAQQLTTVARKILNGPPPPAEPAVLATMRLTILGYLRTVKGYTDEQAAECALIAGRLINYCIEFHNAVHRRWDPPHKHRLAEIARTEPALHREMVRALDGRLGIADRVRSGEAVVRAVLGERAETDDLVGPRIVHAG